MFASAIAFYVTHIAPSFVFRSNFFCFVYTGALEKISAYACSPKLALVVYCWQIIPTS
jgi:hypothetical protein